MEYVEALNGDDISGVFHCVMMQPIVEKSKSTV